MPSLDTNSLTYSQPSMNKHAAQFTDKCTCCRMFGYTPRWVGLHSEVVITFRPFGERPSPESQHFDGATGRDTRQ
jgi:hypothetical protein